MPFEGALTIAGFQPASLRGNSAINSYVFGALYDVIRSRAQASRSAGGRGMCRVGGLDDGVDAPPPLLVRYADDGEVGEGRVAVQRRLDLGGIDIRPTGDDHVHVLVRDAKNVHLLAALGGDANYLHTGDADLRVLAGDLALGPLRIVTVRVIFDVGLACDETRGK